MQWVCGVEGRVVEGRMCADLEIHRPLVEVGHVPKDGQAFALQAIADLQPEATGIAWEGVGGGFECEPGFVVGGVGNRCEFHVTCETVLRHLE